MRQARPKGGGGIDSDPLSFAFILYPTACMSDSRPTMESLKKMDEEDRLNWTRGEFEIPSVKACGGDGGEFDLNNIELIAETSRWRCDLLLRQLARLAEQEGSAAYHGGAGSVVD